MDTEDESDGAASDESGGRGDGGAASTDGDAAASGEAGADARVDQDAQASLSVSVEDVQLWQGSDIVFVLALSRSDSAELQIHVKTRAGTALEGVDFVGLDTTVKIPAGQLRAEVRVAALVRELNTADVNMALQLSELSRGSLARATATATIRAPQRALRLKQIASGGQETCGIDMSDRVFCWGGTLSAFVGAHEVQGLAGAKQVALGSAHACALTANQTVKCWGSNRSGALGNGSTEDSAAPVDVVGLSGVKQIAAGLEHTCAISASDDVRCWGNYIAAHTLLDGQPYPSSPTPVVVAGTESAVQVATGNNQTCVLRADGNVRCWSGYDDLLAKTVVARQVTGFSGIAALGTFYEHVCAITTAGRAKCLGVTNNFGQLGDGTTADPPNTSALAPVDVVDLDKVAQLSAGGTYSCARTQAGAALCWGAVDRTEQGAVSSTSRPTPVAGIGVIKQISAGERHTCVIAQDDSVRCWGENNYGQLGSGAYLIPTDTLRRSDVTQIAGDLALARDGSVRRVDAPTREVPGLANVSLLASSAAPYGHDCAITASGGVRCWGANNFGQLGNGTKVASDTAVDVIGVSDAKQVASSAYHTCAITRQGALYCWGWNGSGQLGTGTDPFSMTALQVSSVQNAKQVVAGSEHTCVINAQDRVQCWGGNYSGQLGDGSTSMKSSAPVDVDGLTGIKQLSAILAHTCAVDGTGAVYCWGANDRGQLAMAPSDAVRRPVRIAGLAGVKQVAAGNGCTCVIASDERVRCWGNNAYGQLGTLSTESSIAPVEMWGVSQVQQISAATRGMSLLLANGQTRRTGMPVPQAGPYEPELVTVPVSP